jgi:hypothetical protein
MDSFFSQSQPHTRHIIVSLVHHPNNKYWAKLVVMLVVVLAEGEKKSLQAVAMY